MRIEFGLREVQRRLLICSAGPCRARTPSGLGFTVGVWTPRNDALKAHCERQIDIRTLMCAQWSPDGSWAAGSAPIV